ncbi:MAG TPA: aldehyde dehydrogenase family protein [Vicinamibacterales bacterium]|jgi:succinate-semialdehyde dehydrogenase/glutarate-semialdehyde dehydrogenase|nr:aldehyde dehydrogenase family protein [Vicinamibacterales bacterium]
MKSTAERAKLLIGGAWVAGGDTYQVTDKFSGEVIGEADRASSDQVAAAVAEARRSFETTRLDAYERFRLLQKASELIERRRQEFAETITAESGIPIADALNEATRAAQTLLLSAEEAKRLHGEIVPIDGAPGQSHRMALTIRVPRGVVCSITSFNSPLNVVAHKVGPALASGNTVVIKPAQATPFSAAKLCEILLEAGIPPGHVNLVQGPGAEIGGWLAENKDIAFYTFTGSTAVGKQLQRAVGLRPVALELGSIAGTIVCDDADLGRAAPRCAASAFRRAGQVCTSTQRLFVQEKIFDAFLDAFACATRQLKVGDPHDPATMVGPMISEREAGRAQEWIREAVSSGARLVAGGERTGALLQPTILTDVRPEMRVICQEIFAPVVSVIRFGDLDDVIAQFNATPFGLAAGVFTQDIMRAMSAARRLHVGIVHINEPSSSRVDLMPFAGVKDSGLGREGPKYAMREMTEERLITISLS